MNKAAVMVGGTFNPITKAHLEMGHCAGERYPDADIIYIPSNLHFIAGWKKVVDNDVFGDKYRLQLVREAVSPYGFLVDDVELRGLTDGTTYETVQYLKKKGYERVVVCIGYDKAGELHKWYRAEELLKTASFLIFSREGNMPCMFGTEGHFEMADLAEDFQGISSTKVRDAYWKGDFDTIQAMVPETVCEFLRGKRNESV